MANIKTAYKIGLYVAILFIMTGCWDQRELENKAYVIGLGIDSGKSKDQVKVTMLIANPEVGSMQGGGGSIEEPKEIITIDAHDFVAAKSIANAIVSRDISYELLNIIVVSEEFAKRQDFLNWLSGTLYDKEIRLNTYLAVSKEKASEYFLHNHPKMETRPHKYFQFMIMNGVYNGLIPDSTLFRFFKSVERGTDAALVMYTSAEKEKKANITSEDEYTAGQVPATGKIDKTQFIGSAVFKKGVMIEKLTGLDTRMINILDDTANMESILVNVPDPFSEEKQQIVLRVVKTENNQFKMNLNGGTPEITITVPLEFEVLSNPSMVNFASEKNKQLLKSHIRDHMKSLYEKFLKKTQEDFQASPFPLSVYARKYFATNQQFEKFNWEKQYPKAEITIVPNVTISDYGKSIQRTKKARD